MPRKKAEKKAAPKTAAKKEKVQAKAKTTPKKGAAKAKKESSKTKGRLVVSQHEKDEIDAVIDPADTRQTVLKAFQSAQGNS